MSVATLTASEYGEIEHWNEFFDNNKGIDNMGYDLSWHVLFSQLSKHPKYAQITEKLKNIVRRNKAIKIYPFPAYVFKAFQVTKATDLKVVIIGQDPYFNCEYHDGKYVPQAMGLSFSVPHNTAIPSSLVNIYDNMIKFGHLKERPHSGNLWFWAVQGCLMLNAALTVEDGTKESHLKMWEWFTDYTIQYISTYMDEIIFVLWGAYACKKLGMIDQSRHHVIMSSHPSGLSANKPLGRNPAFMDKDTFGEINKQLKKYKKETILWA